MKETHGPKWETLPTEREGKIGLQKGIFKRDGFIWFIIEFLASATIAIQ
jgi:hypothetical protein